MSKELKERILFALKYVFAIVFGGFSCFLCINFSIIASACQYSKASRL